MRFNELSAPTAQVMAPRYIDPWKAGKIRYSEAIMHSNTILPIRVHVDCKVCFCGPCNDFDDNDCLQIPCPICVCVLPSSKLDGLCMIWTLCGVPIPLPGLTCCRGYTSDDGSFMWCMWEGEGGVREHRFVLLDEEAQIINWYDKKFHDRSAAKCSLVPITKLLKVGC